jgi:hypothetical protein
MSSSGRCTAVLAVLSWCRFECMQSATSSVHDNTRAVSCCSSDRQSSTIFLHKDAHKVRGFPQVAAGRSYKAGTGSVQGRILVGPTQDDCRVRLASSVTGMLYLRSLRYDKKRLQRRKMNSLIESPASRLYLDSFQSHPALCII